MLRLILLLALAGCADPRANMSPSQRALYDRCDYEAAKATAGIANGFEQGYQRGTLRNQCYAIGG